MGLSLLFLSRSCAVFASVGLFIDAAPCSVQTTEFNALGKRRSSEPMCCWTDNSKMMKRKKKTEKMHQNQNWGKLDFQFLFGSAPLKLKTS